MVIITVRSEVEISKAIRKCVKLCLPSNTDTQQRVDDFVQDLLAKGWQEADLRQVKNGVLFVLAYLQKNNATYSKKESGNQQ
jgi:hypothetical protein